MIKFIVEQDPIAQPRPKARRIGPGIQIYTPNSGPIGLYKAAIREAFGQAVGEGFVPLEGPLRLSVYFVMERPQSRMKEDSRHIVKPDLDNLVKAVMDALNHVAWGDDSQICELEVRKRWADTLKGGASGRKTLSAGSYIDVRLEALWET